MKYRFSQEIRLLLYLGIVGLILSIIMIFGGVYQIVFSGHGIAYMPNIIMLFCVILIIGCGIASVVLINFGYLANNNVVFSNDGVSIETKKGKILRK